MTQVKMKQAMKLLSMAITYYGNKGCSLIKSCIHKIKSHNTKDKSNNTKDKTPILNQSFAVYEFVCPGCSANYVGKTERTLFEGNIGHAIGVTMIILLKSILMNPVVFSICSILPN